MHKIVMTAEDLSELFDDSLSFGFDRFMVENDGVSLYRTGINEPFRIGEYGLGTETYNLFKRWGLAASFIPYGEMIYLSSNAADVFNKNE